MARKKSLVAVVFSTHNKAYLTLSHQLYKRKRKSFSWTHRWVLSWKWYTQPRAFKIQVSVQCNPLQETSSTKDFVVSLQEVVVRTFLLRYTHTFAATGSKSHLPGRTKVTRGFLFPMPHPKLIRSRFLQAKHTVFDVAFYKPNTSLSLFILSWQTQDSPVYIAVVVSEKWKKGEKRTFIAQFLPGKEER